MTADALYCQRETCELILEHGGDYCLQRGGGNQREMLADVRAFAEDQCTDCLDEQTTTDADHGCLEERSYRLYDLPQYLEDTHHIGRD